MRTLLEVLALMTLAFVFVMVTSFSPLTKNRIENYDGKSDVACVKVKDIPVPAVPKIELTDLKDVIGLEAAGQNLNPKLVQKMCQAESGMNPYPRDGAAGEIGSMQLMPYTARDVIIRNGLDPNLDIRDPQTNIKLACLHIKWLKEQLGKYGDDERIVVLAYNKGLGYAKKNLAKYGYQTLKWKGIRWHQNMIYRAIFNSRYKDLRGII